MVGKRKDNDNAGDVYHDDDGGDQLPVCLFFSFLLFWPSECWCIWNLVLADRHNSVRPGKLVTASPTTSTTTLTLPQWQRHLGPECLHVIRALTLCGNISPRLLLIFPPDTFHKESEECARYKPGTGHWVRYIPGKCPTSNTELRITPFYNLQSMPQNCWSVNISSNSATFCKLARSVGWSCLNSFCCHCRHILPQLKISSHKNVMDHQLKLNWVD